MDQNNTKYNLPTPVPPSYNGNNSRSNSSAGEFETGLIPVEAELNIPQSNNHKPSTSSSAGASLKSDSLKPDSNSGYEQMGDMYNIRNPTGAAWLNADKEEKQAKRKCAIPKRALFISIIVLAVLVIIAIVVVAILVNKRNSSPSLNTSSGGVQSETTYTMMQSRTASITSQSTLLSTSAVMTTSSQSEESRAPTPTAKPTFDFTIPLGKHTMTVSNIQTKGHSSLCSYQWWQIPYTYTIVPSVTAKAGIYTAAWNIPDTYDHSMRDTATAPVATATPAAWRFQEEVTFQYDGCSMGGTETIELAEDGTATYISRIEVENGDCSIEFDSYDATDACVLSWTGQWKN